jgi:hypothetical protein
MKQLFENQFCTIMIDSQNILWINWNANTATMTDEDFKTILLENAKLLKQHKSVNNVVDVRAFRGPRNEDLMKWRTTQLLPMYVEAGLKK